MKRVLYHWPKVAKRPGIEATEAGKAVEEDSEENPELEEGVLLVTEKTWVNIKRAILVIGDLVLSRSL